MCMSKEEAASLQLGDKVEVLSYPEMVRSAAELDLITEEEKEEILSRFQKRGCCAYLLESPTGVGFIDSMSEFLGKTLTIKKRVFNETCFPDNFSNEYTFDVKETCWTFDRMMFRGGGSHETTNTIGDDEFGKLF